MLAPSSYLKSVVIQVNTITPCNSYDICKHYLVKEKQFASKVTGETYFITRDFPAVVNVIYLINCDKYKDEYIGLVVNFKPRLKVHRSDIKTKKRNVVVLADVSMKNLYVPLLLLNMSNLK